MTVSHRFKTFWIGANSFGTELRAMRLIVGLLGFRVLWSATTTAGKDHDSEN